MQGRFEYLSVIALILGLGFGPASASDAYKYDKYTHFSDFLVGGATRPNEKSAPADNAERGYYLDPKGIALPASDDSRENKFDNTLDYKPVDHRPIRSQSAKHMVDDKFRHPASPDICPSSPLSSEEIVALIEAVARKYEVKPDFALAVAWAESRFDRIRNSPKGARGPMQLMLDTAGDLGVTDICDPAANIDGGVRYLRDLVEEFQNPLLAAAAYNAGPKTVRDHGGIPPYSETLNYLSEILNFQLGLRPRRTGEASNKPTKPSRDNGVVGAVSGRRFVGGVMKF